MSTELENQSKNKGFVRTFVGIDINDKNKRILTSLMASLNNDPQNQQIGWQKVDKLHITLRFLGNTPIDQIATLTEQFKLAAKQISPFKVSLDNVHLFPSSHKARYIALNVQPEEKLKALVEIMEQTAIANGFTAETRTYRGHLTLGKIRSKPKPKLEMSTTHPIAEQMVNEIIFYESQPDNNTTRYLPIATLPLNQGDLLV